MSRVISGQMNGKQDEENMVLRTLGVGFMAVLTRERVVYIRYNRGCRRIARAVDFRTERSSKSYKRLINKSMNILSIKPFEQPTSLFSCAELFRLGTLSTLTGIVE